MRLDGPAGAPAPGEPEAGTRLVRVNLLRPGRGSLIEHPLDLPGKPPPELHSVEAGRALGAFRGVHRVDVERRYGLGEVGGPALPEAPGHAIDDGLERSAHAHREDGPPRGLSLHGSDAELLDRGDHERP